MPGSLSYVTSQASQEDTTAIGSFAYQADSFLSDRLTLDLKGSYHYAQEIYNDPLAPPESIHATNSASLDLTQRLALSDEISAVYGGNSSYEVVDSTNLYGTNDRLTLAGFLSVPFSPLRTLTITPSVRYDYYSDFPGFLSVQLGTVLNLSEVSSLHASVGSAYRVPTLSDLYWTDPYGDTGNPNLKPETSYSGEVGWSLQEKGFSLQTAVFARMMFNQIEWVFNSVTFTTNVVNITESFLPGFEVHGKVGLTDRFSVQADYAFIYSFLLQYPGFNYQLSDNQRVPWVPVHNLTLAVKYQDSQNTASVEAQYVSEKTYFDSGLSAWATLLQLRSSQRGLQDPGDQLACVFHQAAEYPQHAILYRSGGIPDASVLHHHRLGGKAVGVMEEKGGHFIQSLALALATFALLFFFLGKAILFVAPAAGKVAPIEVQFGSSGGGEAGSGSHAAAKAPGGPPKQARAAVPAPMPPKAAVKAAPAVAPVQPAPAVTPTAAPPPQPQENPSAAVESSNGTGSARGSGPQETEGTGATGRRIRRRNSSRRRPGRGFACRHDCRHRPRPHSRNNRRLPELREKARPGRPGENPG